MVDRTDGDGEEDIDDDAENVPADIPVGDVWPENKVRPWWHYFEGFPEDNPDAVSAYRPHRKEVFSPSRVQSVKLKQKRRQERKKQPGMCSYCGIRPRMKKWKACEVCREYNQKRRPDTMRKKS